MVPVAENCRDREKGGPAGPPPLPAPVKAQLILAQTHLETGRQADAFSCFEIAARSGHPLAMNMLGRAYERGWGVTRNPVMAARCFESAVAGGDGWAMFNLADLFLAGEGVPKNDRMAYRLYVDAARAGNVKALNMLGVMHEAGTQEAGPRTGPDLSGACQFYQAAAEGGDCWAWLNLARLALERGARSNAVQALDRALDLAIAGVPDAALALIGRHRGEQAFQTVLLRCMTLMKALSVRDVSHAS